MCEFTYIEIGYVSCEGNDRWTTAKVPEDWNEDEVVERLFYNSSYGDDPAEFKYVKETLVEDPDYDWMDLHEEWRGG